MSNNTTLNTMTGGDVIQTIDNGTYKTQTAAIVDSTGANTLAVDANGAISVSAPDKPSSGSLTAAAQNVNVTCSNESTAFVQVTGTWAGTIVFEGTVDGTTYFSVNAVVPTTGALATSATANGQWAVDVSGLQFFQVRHSVHTSGTVVVNVRLSARDALIGLDQPLPAGSNTIGTVNLSNSSTNSVNIGYVAGTATPTGTNGALPVAGQQATGAARSANPVLAGGVSAIANPTANGSGQVSYIMVDKVGRLVTVSSHIRDLVATQATTITSSTTAATVVTAAGASVFADLTFLSISNGSGTPTTVTLSDGTVSMVFNIPAGGGLISNFNPPLKATTANTAWTATCGTSVASVYVAAQYVKNL